MGFLDAPKRYLPLKQEFSKDYCVKCKSMESFHFVPNKSMWRCHKWFCTMCGVPLGGWDDEIYHPSYNEWQEKMISK